MSLLTKRRHGRRFHRQIHFYECKRNKFYAIKGIAVEDKISNYIFIYFASINKSAMRRREGNSNL